MISFTMHDTQQSFHRQVHKESGLLGLRLAKSAHIGHLFGNVSPAVDAMKTKNVYMILADLFTLTSGRAKNVIKDNFINITSDCIASGLDGDNVYYCIQSKSMSEISTLIVFCNYLITLGQLSQIQPIKNILSSNATNIPFSDLTFPIIQSAEIIATRSSELYSNIDNLGVVSLASKLSKTIAHLTSVDIPVPRLKHGILRSLRGTDKRKMGYGNNNFISVLDSFSEIENKIARMRTDPDTALSDLTLPADLTLVFEYCRVFGHTDEEINQFRMDYSRGKTTALQIKKHLAVRVANYLLPIKQKREYLLNTQYDKIWDRINSDTNIVCQLLKRNVKEISDALGFNFK